MVLLEMFVAVLDDLRQEERKRNVIFKAELDELKQRCAEKQELVDQERLQLMERKKEVALVAINSRTGKTIPPKVYFVSLNKAL